MHEPMVQQLWKVAALAEAAREKQRAYFATKSRAALRQARGAEKALDDALEALKAGVVQSDGVQDVRWARDVVQARMVFPGEAVQSRLV